MIACEREFLKAHGQFGQLVEQVRQASQDGRRIDEVERMLFSELLAVGYTLLKGFVKAAGDGDQGETFVLPVETENCLPELPVLEKPCGEAPSPRTLKRLPDPHFRRYVSIFGELEITRFVYGTREGQAIEAVPLDAQLGLPAGDFSYVLEDWQQRLCVKESLGEATADLRAWLGLAPSVRAAEVMNRKLAEFAPGFRAEQLPPPAQEEAEIFVFTADGKGVPMRRPAGKKRAHGQRRRKGEKANKKQMACVGAVYSIAPFVRTADEVLDELERKEAAYDRPQPQHKHVLAEMTRVLDGETFNGRVTLFAELSDELRMRNRGGRKPVVALMDGEAALWEAQREFLPEAVGILDLFHVLERLWNAAHVFHAEGSPKAKAFVDRRLRMLLEGQVGAVIGGFKQMLTKQRLKGSKRRALQTVIGYFENNREHMRYDEYLAAGYPIGSGVAEGACRHLVKDRMEQTGMRWVVDGAQAMLHLRALYLNGDWNNFVTYRIHEEQATLYPYKTLLPA